MQTGALTTYSDCARVGSYEARLPNPGKMSFCKGLQLFFSNLWHANKIEVLSGLGLVILGAVVVSLGGVLIPGVGLFISAPIANYLLTAGCVLLTVAVNDARHITNHQVAGNSHDSSAHRDDFEF